MNAIDNTDSAWVSPHRAAFLLLTQKSLEQLSGSMKTLAIAARPDGTNLTNQVNQAALYFEKLLPRIDVIRDVAPTLHLSNRFRDRLACCVQDVWINLTIQIAEPLQQCVRALSVSTTDGQGPTSGHVNYLRKNLEKLRNVCLDHEKNLESLRLRVATAIGGSPDSALELTEITNRYPLSSEAADEVERQLLNNKGTSIDYLIKIPEYAVGLGFTKRYFATYKCKSPMPDPVCTRTKSRSLRALHAWYRDDVRAAGNQTNKCWFDPVRVEKHWIRFDPPSAQTVPPPHL